MFPQYVSELSVNSDFFESGGDSMKAGQLVSQMRKKFSVNLPSTCVFIYRSVDKLAACILQQSTTSVRKSHRLNERKTKKKNNPSLGCFLYYGA